MLMWCKLLALHDSVAREEDWLWLGAGVGVGFGGRAGVAAADREEEGGEDDGEGCAARRDASLWTLYPDLMGSFVACMVRLSESQHSHQQGAAAAAQAAAYQHKALQMLGHLGPPDLLSMQHAGPHGAPRIEAVAAHRRGATSRGEPCGSGRIPTLARTTDASELEFDEDYPTVSARKAGLFALLFGLLWEDPQTSSVASAALRLMAANRCFDDPEAAEAAIVMGVRDEFELYQAVPLTCRPQARGPETLVDASSGFIPISSMHGHASQAQVFLGGGSRGPQDAPRDHLKGADANPWCPELWATTGKTYAGWVTRLVPALLRAFCGLAARSFMGAAGAVFLLPDPVGNGAHIETDPAPGTAGTRTDRSSPATATPPPPDHLTKFLAPLVEACMLRHAVATAVFPLLLYDMLTAGPHVRLAKQRLSECFAGYLLAPTCSLPKATRLACTTLVFLLRQEIHSWRDASMAAAEAARPRGKKKSKEATKGGLPSLYRPFPYSYSLDIDYKFAAYAAERCGCVCTALLFAELSEEERRSASDHHSLTLPAAGFSAYFGSGGGAREVSAGRDSPRASPHHIATPLANTDVPSGRSADLFVRIFRKVCQALVLI